MKDMLSNIIGIINEEGKIYLVTKGDNAISKDRLKVSEENFLGVVTFSSHFLGKCITLMNKGGIFVVLALMLIIATMVFIKQNIEYHHGKKEEIEEKRKENSRNCNGKYLFFNRRKTYHFDS